MIKRIAILILLAAVAAHASDTRVLVDTEWGTASGLGYKLPHLAAGTTVEQPLGNHWEAQGEVSVSPDRKYITNDGKSAQAGATVLFWPIQRIGLTGGASYTRLWTSQFQKGELFPSAGIVVRDTLDGSPGRFYVRYLFPTGCQWGADCVIQSSRLSGVEGFQEFQVWPHWRIGFRGAWWRFAEQGNPLDRAAGRTWHNTGTAAMVIRYGFRGANSEASY